MKRTCKCGKLLSQRKDKKSTRCRACWLKEQKRQMRKLGSGYVIYSQTEVRS